MCIWYILKIADWEKMNTNNSVSEKQCKTCGGYIPEIAKKCVKCGHYFVWWRRWLGWSHGTLALLVALVTVITYGVPILQRSFTPDMDNLRVRLLNVDNENNEITLFVSNIGTRAAALKSVDLIASPLLAASTTVPSINLKLPKEKLIRSGESREVVLIPENDELPRLPKLSDRKGEYSIFVSIVRFDGTIVEKEIKFDVSIE